MNKLYLVGGPPRAGKSIIMDEFLHQKPMHHISTDAVQEGARHIFHDDPFQILRKVQFKGWIEFKKRGTKDIAREEFSSESNEVDLARRVVLGMLDHYRRSRSDVAVEGLHVTPEWVNSLSIAGFTVVAAFVGYTNPNYIDGILEHARTHEHDWINEWLSIHDGDDTQLCAWVTERTEESREAQKQAQELGYPFFDASAKPFAEYVSEVQTYLYAN